VLKSKYLLRNSNSNCSFSQHLNHRSLNDLLIDEGVDGAVKQLIHDGGTAHIGLLEALLIPDVDVSHDEFAIPASGHATIAES
jgi:hypothetical protein